MTRVLFCLFLKWISPAGNLDEKLEKRTGQNTCRYKMQRFRRTVLANTKNEKSRIIGRKNTVPDLFRSLKLCEKRISCVKVSYCIARKTSCRTDCWGHNSVYNVKCTS